MHFIRGIADSGGLVGNHGPIPYVNAENHVVKVDGEVLKPLQLSVEDLKTRFKQYEIVSALQCAGNRRHIMRTLLKEVNGLDWFEGAVMNCQWRGPKLKDVLNEAGISVKNIKDYHVAFACHQVPVQGGESWYGGSIELARAMKESADVLIALEVFALPSMSTTDGFNPTQMNRQPLPVRHGYPIRIVVPGVSGVSQSFLTFLSIWLPNNSRSSVYPAALTMYADFNELLVPLCQVVRSYNGPARRIHEFVPAVRLQNLASFGQG